LYYSHYINIYFVVAIIVTVEGSKFQMSRNRVQTNYIGKGGGGSLQFTVAKMPHLELNFDKSLYALLHLTSSEINTHPL